MRIWQCPGPMRLVNTLSDTLCDGRSVILLTPALAPDDLESAIRSVMGGWSLTTIEDNGAKPARQILEAAWLDEPLANEVTAATLLERHELSGKIFWCTPNDSKGVQHWLAFLDEYALATRTRPDVDRPRIVLSLVGDLACPSPVKKVGIDVFDVGIAVTHSDLLLLAYFQIGASQRGTIKSQVIAQTAAAIALWDVNLLSRLLDESPDQLFDPAPLLREYAAERGWMPDMPPSWESGTLRKLSAKDEIHSAHAALNDAKGVIPSRVWAGQAAVLLPAIERRRMELIENNYSLLARELPFKTAYETITDAYDLQIGPVWYLLKKRNGPASAMARALRLKKARDSLAHMNPLTPSDAFSREVTGE